MSLNVLQIIALLCQVHYGGYTSNNMTRYEESFLTCQQYYLKCARADSANWATSIENCVLKRKISQ